MAHTLVLNSDGNPLGFLPISALSWQDAIKALVLGTVTRIADYTNWTVRSPSATYIVPSVVMTARYVKVPRNATFTNRMLFLRDGHRCQYCGEIFPAEKLTVDHVTPRSKGGTKTWANLVAACSPCNSKRGANDTIRPLREPFRPTYGEMVKVAREHPIIVPHETWLPFLGWPDHLIRVVPPSGEPGQSRPRGLTRRLLSVNIECDA